MAGLMADLRHALVVYRGTPVATAIAVLALAAAMAVVSAFLSMWSDLSLKPPTGFERSGRLVTIGQAGGYAAADSSAPLTLDIVEGINAAVNSLESAAGVTTFAQMLHGDETQLSIQAEAVTRHFSDLGPRLQIGQRFDDADHRPEAEPVVILSYRLWQEEFGGRTDALGETVRITEIGFNTAGLPAGVLDGFEPREQLGQDYRIVGIMSPRMTGTFADATDAWLPYEQAVPFLYGEASDSSPRELGTAGLITSRAGAGSESTRMRGLARLAPGAGAEAAANELNTRFEIDGQAFVSGFNLSGEEIRFDVIGGLIKDIAIQRESRRQVLLFLSGTLLLVVVAICNISLFLLARASRRQRELGIRMSVGASIKRLSRQLATEAGLLILASTVVGVLISVWLAAALRELPFLQQADWRDVSPFDWRVLGMLAGLMLLLTLLVSLSPMLGVARMGIGASSAMVTARAGIGQRLAGTVQIALTGIVGAVALAFVWHLVFYATADRGFDATDVLVVELERIPVSASAGPAGGFGGGVAERERQRELIVGLPGVEAASFASFAPGGAGNVSFTVIQRASGEYVEYGTIYTDASYVDVLDISLAYGSTLDPYDPLQLVGNQVYAVDRFGRANAIGEVTPTSYTLQGVMADVPFGHPAAAIPPLALSSYPQGFYPLLLVETALGPAELRRLLQARIDAAEVELAIGNVVRLADIANRDLLADRARATLTASAALLVVILAAFGFYGTQRYLVTAGQREYAIRAAVGASPLALSRLVVRRSLGMGLPGLIFGSVLAFIAVAWLRDGFVTEAVAATSVSLAVTLVIVTLVLAASAGPARQARNTAPAELLREDQ